MADNAFVKIGTALLKHQVKKLVGEEAMGAIGEELAEIGGDKLDSWLGDKSTIEELEKAAKTAEACFHDSVGDHDLEQWMVSLPIGDLPKVLEAIEKLPTSPGEKQLESEIRNAVAGWRKLSPEQIDKAVNSFLSCLRSALLPIEKQTLMVIGRSVLRIEDKVDLLTKLVEQLRPYSTGAKVESRFGDITVGGNVGGNVTVGNNNVVNNNIINNYYQQEVKKNIEKHEPDFWALKHPYPMPKNFTGRIAERAMLTQWLNEDSENHLFILRALGGFGKSALSWQWLTHDVKPDDFPKVLWWSFYEGDASFEHFIEETLKYLKLDIPQGQRPQVDELLKAMQSQKVLLIMDGFERVLRLYGNMNAAYQGDEEQKIEDYQLDCVNISAEVFLKNICVLPHIKGKVLLTTRLTPRVLLPRGEILRSCIEKELKEMNKTDAVAFFQAQGIKGMRTEIESACSSYGYHPLSLRILACLIINNRENPNDIVVAESLDITDDIVQNKNHVLKIAYNSLTSGQQKLLSNFSCFRSLMNYQALKVVSGIPLRRRKKTRPSLKENLSDSLQKLETSGLLDWDRKTNKYDLHPIVRRYAYERLPISERITVHTYLQEYFSAIKSPKQLKTLNDLTSIIELYYHTVRAGHLDTAYELFYDKFGGDIHYRFGAYGLEIGLLKALVEGNEIGSLTKDGYRSFVFSQLANAYTLSGQPHRAVELYQREIFLHEHEQSKENLGIILANLAGLAQIPIGAFHAAELNIRRSLNIGKDIKSKIHEVICHQDLGSLLAYCGKWKESEEELEIAKNHFDELGVTQTNYVSVVRAHFAQLYILNKNFNKAIELAKEAVNLSQHPNRTRFAGERDVIRSHWLLGAAYRFNGQFEPAEHHLNEALTRDRAINLVQEETNILLDLARLRYDQKKYEEAKSLAEEALTITERCGYVLQGADVNLFLAQYALEQEKDKAKAKQYAEEAKKLATCDGPPYYYKVAYEEAERMLEKL